MLQIKTIKGKMESAEAFDKELNEALAEGWELKRREVVSSYSANPILYAELEIDIEGEDDRLCETCAHQFKEPQEQPCIECDGDCSRWEPKNLEKPQKAEEPEEEEICEACMIHYDDEPKEEEKRECYHCRHSGVAWEPKEEKSCGNCKFKNIGEHDEPCIYCRGMITRHSKWEPIDHA